eukprot:28495_1
MNNQKTSIQMEGVSDLLIVSDHISEAEIMHANNSDSTEYITHFRSYLKSKKKDNGCCCDSCCSLQTALCWWFTYFILSSLWGLIAFVYNVFFYIEIDVIYSKYFIYACLWGAYHFIFLCVTISCIYGLYKCIPFAFLLQIIMLFTRIITGIYYDLNCLLHMPYCAFPSTMLQGIINIIFVIFYHLWAIYIFYRVYKWSKYFKNGGTLNISLDN